MDRKEAALLSVNQVAETLGVTSSCIRRWVLERKIATVKLGRLVRVPATEINRLLEIGLRPVKAKR